MSTSDVELCPECRKPLDFDEVDIGVGVQRGNYNCPFCYWSPGATKVSCECGCGKMGYTSMTEYHHAEDFKHER